MTPPCRIGSGALPMRRLKAGVHLHGRLGMIAADTGHHGASPRSSLGGSARGRTPRAGTANRHEMALGAVNRTVPGAATMGSGVGPTGGQKTRLLANRGGSRAPGAGRPEAKKNATVRDAVPGPSIKVGRVVVVMPGTTGTSVGLVVREAAKETELRSAAADPALPLRRNDSRSRGSTRTSLASRSIVPSRTSCGR